MKPLSPHNLLAIGKHCLEDVIVEAVVESEDELIEVGLEVFSRYTMVDTDNRSLEEAPEVLHPHRVDVSVDECLGVADGFMLSTSSSLGVALEFIGDEQFCANADEGIEDRGKCFGFEVLDDLCCDVTTSLLEPHNYFFAGSATPTLPTRFLATNVSVVGFDDTAELIFKPIPWPHGLSDLHTDAPSALVGDAKSPFELFSGDTFLGIAHQPDSDIPFLKRSMGTMKDGVCCHGELVSAGGALPHLTLFEPVGIVSSTLGTSDAVGPALGAKKLLALVLGGEPFLQLDDVHDSSFWNHYSTSSGLCQGDKAIGKSNADLAVVD